MGLWLVRGNGAVVLWTESMDFDYIQGALQPAEGKLAPYFFYHVKKTGGITVFSSAYCGLDAWKLFLRTNNISCPDVFCGRLDDNKYQSNQEIRFAAPAMFIASHLPFGVHARVRQAFRLMTLLRDPWGRAKSQYSYLKMRATESPSLDEFAAFTAKEENCNVMTKQLAGLQPDQPARDADLQQALRNLTDHFFAFGTIQDLIFLTSHILQTNGLPNVISDRINPTRSIYKIECEETDAFRDRNALDIQLYDWVRATPRLPDPLDCQPHSWNVIVQEVGGDAISEQKPRVFSGNISRYLKGTKVSKDILDALN